MLHIFLRCGLILFLCDLLKIESLITNVKVGADFVQRECMSLILMLK